MSRYFLQWLRPSSQGFSNTTWFFHQKKSHVVSFDSVNVVLILLSFSTQHQAALDYIGLKSTLNFYVISLCYLLLPKKKSSQTQKDPENYMASHVIDNSIEHSGDLGDGEEEDLEEEEDEENWEGNKKRLPKLNKNIDRHIEEEKKEEDDDYAITIELGEQNQGEKKQTKKNQVF